MDHFLPSSAAFPFHSYLQAEKNVFSISSAADSLHSQRKGKPRPGGKGAPTGTNRNPDVCSSSVNSWATLAKNEITFLFSCMWESPASPLTLTLQRRSNRFRELKFPSCQIWQLPSSTDQLLGWWGDAGQSQGPNPQIPVRAVDVDQ